MALLAFLIRRKHESKTNRAWLGWAFHLREQVPIPTQYAVGKRRCPHRRVERRSDGKWTGDPRQDRNVRGFEPIGCNRYYETMVFHAEPAPSRFFDADVRREINFAAPWCIAEIDAEDKANAQHDAVVSEIEERMAAGEFDNANPTPVR